ncbi:MAG: hypothetical protein GX119_01750 [Syntrophomonadaceae bacterium]|jgi:REP element-mobilizing transposase RayT|nr:hypothetical protein [Syntrophomonadaceae bacterium]
MSRDPRVYGYTSCYHIMVRRRKRKISLLNRKQVEIHTFFTEQKTDFGFGLYSYCLVSKHVHMVFRKERESLSRTMKRINTNYGGTVPIVNCGCRS